MSKKEFIEKFIGLVRIWLEKELPNKINDERYFIVFCYDLLYKKIRHIRDSL
jgi:hypothetical protein